MQIKKKRTWELPEAQVTDESVFFNRRQVLKAMGYGLVASAAMPSLLQATTAGFPSQLNSNYSELERDLTQEDLVTSYNNFYEFGFDKADPKHHAQKLKTDPWTLEVTGLVKKPQKFDANELAKQMGLEQRIYRFRCVEAWSMVVPWDGFQLSKLIELVQPLQSAKYVKFETFYDPDVAPGQRRSSYPWPYVEGLRMDEAMHELSLMVCGVYGKPLPNQNGAPLRLMVPWKYGFKSIKSIVKIEFTDTMPQSLWMQLAPREYGFYANVNPNVDHPRWSQKREKPLGSWFNKIDTLMFNGYEEQVAHLYKGMDLTQYY